MPLKRRPVSRENVTPRARVIPRVDFISIQKEIAENLQMSRVMRLKDHAVRNAKNSDSMSGSIAAANKAILTPALRLGFSVDRPAY